MLGKSFGEKRAFAPFSPDKIGTSFAEKLAFMLIHAHFLE